MIRKTLSVALLAALASVGAGCTQAQGTKNKTTYYRDKRVPIGSNIPKSYHDDESVSGRTVSEMDRESFSRTPQMATPVGGGGPR